AARSSRREQEGEAEPRRVRGHGRLDGRALCPRSPGDRDPPGPQSVGNRAPRVPPGVSASGEGETHPEVCAGREVGVVLEVGHVLSSEVFFCFKF
ncbi:hypothetical protein DBR06_SOUSAS10410023, partial [Sousa chinensis]